MKWSVLFFVLLFSSEVNGNEILADTFQSIDMRDQALFQLIIGTIAIAVISVCIMGFMLIFQCYSIYCTKKLHRKLPLTSSDDEEKLRTVSFRSIFVEEAMQEPITPCPSRATDVNNNYSKNIPAYFVSTKPYDDLKPSASDNRNAFRHAYHHESRFMSIDEFEKHYMVGYNFSYRKIDLTQYLNKQEASLHKKHFKAELFRKLLKFIRGWTYCGAYFKTDINKFLLRMVDFIIMDGIAAQNQWQVADAIVVRAMALVNQNLPVFVDHVQPMNDWKTGKQ